MEQDWKPTYIGTKINASKQKTTVKVAKPSVNGQSNQSTNLHRLESDNEYKPPKITMDIAKQIEQARIAKKMTQTELANNSMLTLSTIKLYERPQQDSVLNQAVIRKLEKSLGVQIRTK